jgi:hypothetical protein
MRTLYAPQLERVRHRLNFWRKRRDQLEIQ